MLVLKTNEVTNSNSGIEFVKKLKFKINRAESLRIANKLCIL